MIYNYFTYPPHIIKFLEIFLSISLLLSSLQHLKNIHCFSPQGLLPWHMLKRKNIYVWFRSERFKCFFGKRSMLLLNIFRILLLPLFILSEKEEFHFPTLVILTLITYMIYIRSSLMSNAADQVNNVILTGLVISQSLTGYTSDNMIIYFFALLLIISYFTSGLLKAHEANWRNGVYLKQVLITRNFGNPILLKSLNLVNLKVFKLLSQIIVIWQLSSFLTPILPTAIFYCYLFVALSFHLATGLLLRLNGFIWTFTGLLPTLIYLHVNISNYL